MKILNKTPEKDFFILNLSDPQIGIDELDVMHPVRHIIEYTLTDLIARVKPDLITVSGDISWGRGNYEAYKCFADIMQSRGIPWAPVWGNHDNVTGDEFINEIADLYLTYPTCCYEKGDPTLGNGNYVIGIREENQIVEALFMMDTHWNIIYDYLDQNCVKQTYDSYAALTECQLEWYKEQVQTLRTLGCQDSAMIIHIPLYGYREAFFAATEEELRAPGKVSLADSYRGIGWKEEYQHTCFGVNREGISSPNFDDGVFSVFKEYGHTKHVIAGHEHINNFSILHEGIRLTYATKLGSGCYWNSDLNGGTVLTVTNHGVCTLRHEYVDVSHLL